MKELWREWCAENGISEEAAEKIPQQVKVGGVSYQYLLTDMRRLKPELPDRTKKRGVGTQRGPAIVGWTLRPDDGGDDDEAGASGKDDGPDF